MATTASASFLDTLLAAPGPTAADIAADDLARRIARADYLRGARARLGYGRRADAVTLDVIAADRAVASARAVLSSIA